MHFLKGNRQQSALEVSMLGGFVVAKCLFSNSLVKSLASQISFLLIFPGIIQKTKMRHALFKGSSCSFVLGGRLLSAPYVDVVHFLEKNRKQSSIGVSMVGASSSQGGSSPICWLKLLLLKCLFSIILQGKMAHLLLCSRRVAQPRPCE